MTWGKSMSTLTRGLFRVNRLKIPAWDKRGTSRGMFENFRRYILLQQLMIFLHHKYFCFSETLLSYELLVFSSLLSVMGCQPKPELSKINYIKLVTVWGNIFSQRISDRTTDADFFFCFCHLCLMSGYSAARFLSVLVIAERCESGR